ncbi:MAG TPA: Gfo/Idh/MocA family oxidoreductase [Actinotalea caeni]|uniref:Gfo/Idh/MocA family protein n=1 Tax=Actinotalea caeni TaxID=1348467 RepID=UPI002B4AB2DA|nr:Gfo/Idh/MocA family oxidoreductase [Actinotalea caeni]HLV54451.1 Gfo/Idh/MocA family oxidoreductase [Actinotalea caeni]
MTLDLGPDPADAPPLRWGILAAGGIARKFAADIPQHTASTVVAVGSRSRERAEEFATANGVARAHGSYEDLVADPEVEAVYVASPHSEHRDHALLAIEAGKHVLVEKSFTRNAAEAREVLDAARERGVFAMEAMWSRFLPHMVALRQTIASGAIGDVVTLVASHGQPIAHVPRMARPELAGGALLDLGIYPVAFAFDVLGEPSSVHATGWLTDAGVDATLAITFGYERAVAQLSTTMLARTHNVAEIAGTAGRITVAETYYAPTSFTVHPTDGEPWTVAPEVTGGFQFQAAEVARRVHAGELESPVRPWAEIIGTQVAMDEIRRQVGMVLPDE